jgi:hypothetical protein
MKHISMLVRIAPWKSAVMLSLMMAAATCVATVACGSHAADSDSTDAAGAGIEGVGMVGGNTSEDISKAATNPDGGGGGGTEAGVVCPPLEAGACSIAPQCGCPDDSTCDAITDTIAACIKATSNGDIQTVCNVTHVSARGPLPGAAHVRVQGTGRHRRRRVADGRARGCRG